MILKLNITKIKLEYVSKDKINETISFIREKKFRRANFNLTKPYNYFHKTYQVKKKNDSVEVVYCIGAKVVRYKWSAYKAYEYAVENDGLTGQSAYEIINEKYQSMKKNHKSSSLFSDISGQAYKKEYTDIKKCVPAAINFIHPGVLNKSIESIYKADVSSAYPAICCRSLPTLHGCKRVSGRVEPTQDYPFAFYIKSHHIKIYNELDTREFKKLSVVYPQYKKPATETSWQPIDNIPDDKEETILCRDSKLDLSIIFQDLYDNRKSNPENKFIMNAFIGRCQLNSNPFLSHLSAVVLARSVNDMLNRVKVLRSEKSVPIFISTDSIAWKGKESICATDDKYLGSFTYEAKNSKFFARGLKAYQYIDIKGNVAGVCGHISLDDPRRKIYGAIPVVSSMDEHFIVNDDGTITNIM